MFGLPVLGELRLQVLVFGVEELNEVCRLRDPRVAAQKFITIFLQELEAHHGLAGTLPLALHLFVLKKKKRTGRVKSESLQLGAAHCDAQLRTHTSKTGDDFVGLFQFTCGWECFLHLFL